MKPIAVIALLVLCSASAHAGPMLHDYGVRLEVRPTVQASGTQVHLLSGPPIMRGALARGLFDLDGDGPGTAVDSLWVVRNLLGKPAPDGERILTFDFDDTGDFLGISPTPFYDPDVVSGVSPQPFRIFLAAYPPDPIAPAELFGELDFTGITAASLGSVTGITGVVVRVDGGPDLLLDPFDLTSLPEPGALALLLLALPLAALAPTPRRRAG